MKSRLSYAICRPGTALTVSGSDARKFINGLFSNDISNIPPRNSAYGLWLDPKGRVLADGFVLWDVSISCYIIISYNSDAAGIRDHLERHLVADEVELDDQTAQAWLTAVIGEGAGEAAAALGPLVIEGRRGRDPSADWLSFGSEIEAVRASLKARLGEAEELSIADLERIRLEGGVPRIPVDLGPSDLPFEGGLAELAVSYSKGCFVGQEVMARVRSRGGKPRRRLCRVAGEGAPPEVGRTLWQNGKECGQMRSGLLPADATRFLGLAMLPVGALPGVGLSLSQEGPAVLDWREI